MAQVNSDKISFLELAKRVIEHAARPISPHEVWEGAEQSGLVSQLRSTGKTPEATLAAQLYTDVQKPSSPFIKVGSRPARFFLKSLAGSMPNLQPNALVQPAQTFSAKKYAERDLHPLLVWFADFKFGAHSRTVFHERSQKKGEKYNQWVHPDVVGFALTTQAWSRDVVQLAQSGGALAARLYSFEVKKSLDFGTLREFFFQAVSNSTWAHEGYLVAVDIDDDPEFREELTRLSQSFGIGVIQLNTSEPVDSAVLLPARERNEIDWKTVDRITAVNPDFKAFIGSVANSVKINEPTVNGFDKLFNDNELADFVKKSLTT